MSRVVSLVVICLVQRFLVDIGGVSDRTQKVYRYRARVVKIQRWVRSFLECQNARILVSSALGLRFR